MNIALITARGGNISIPNKNLIKIHDKSLLAFIIEAANKSTLIDELYISESVA